MNTRKIKAFYKWSSDLKKQKSTSKTRFFEPYFKNV